MTPRGRARLPARTGGMCGGEQDPAQDAVIAAYGRGVDAAALGVDLRAAPPRRGLARAAFGRGLLAGRAAARDGEFW